MNSPHSMTDSSMVPAARVEEFVKLFAESQKRIRHYVGSLVFNPSDADDVFQETQMVLWREFSSFQPGTNFLAWSWSVAFHQILAWRKRQQRDRLVMSDEFLQAMSHELSEESERLEEKHQLLTLCMNRLPGHQRELLRLRYLEGGSIEKIATALNRTTDAVYRMLSRIRHTLMDCVAQKGVLA